MRLVNLIDDICRDQTYLQEHGTSYYLETAMHKIVIDTGASDAFIENARRKGIDLSQVDTVILTHGHANHCGGLNALLELAPDAVVYIRENAFGAFYDGDNAVSNDFILENARFIGIDPELKTKNQVHLITEDTILDEELQLFTNVASDPHLTSANSKLKCMVDGELIQDDFSHELFLLVQTEGKTILFGGCCHCGVANVMATCKERFQLVPDIMVGGFHLMQPRYCGFGKDDLVLLDTVGNALKAYPTRFYTGHCTGITAYNKLKAYLLNNISYVYCGMDLITE